MTTRTLELRLLQRTAIALMVGETGDQAVCLRYTEIDGFDMGDRVVKVRASETLLRERGLIE